ALVGALIGGGVYAYFSDTETSTGNTFTAGTLDLNLDGGNTNVVKFTVSNVKPGDSDNGTWTVRNVGSIAGYLDLVSCNVTEAIGVTTDPELADEPTALDTTQLGNYLMVHIFVDANNNGSWDSGEADILGTNAAPVAIKTIAASYNLNLSLAASGGTNYITLRWSVPTATGNRIQGDSVTLNITFELDQQP
ncbi:MAG: CalY family protein, partial [Dehalococcoidales bacterium]|nr:CalY family protein [Dehalococcoidales bacterium]